MKKMLLALPVILISVFLSACSQIETAELNERLIIEAIGIDTENGKYIITVEGLDSLTAGSDSNSIASERITKCYRFEGETIGMAMNSISTVTGQIPLFSQARVLILGNSTAKEHLSEALDFFRREYTTRTDILIACAENTAQEVISANYGPNMSAGKILETTLDSYRYTGRSIYMPLFRFLSSLINPTDSALCPKIAVKDNAFSDKKEVYLTGTAVFIKNGGYIALNEDETLAYMILTNSIENGDLTVETKNGICTIEIISCKVRTVTSIKKNRPFFDINADIRCDIPEFQSADFSALTKEDTEEIAEITAQKICTSMSQVLSKFLYTYNCDIFQFGRRLHLEENSFYEKNVLNNESFCSDISCEIQTKTSIRRIGKVILGREENKNGQE